jgi:hypothetical protein
VQRESEVGLRAALLGTAPGRWQFHSGWHVYSGYSNISDQGDVSWNI